MNGTNELGADVNEDDLFERWFEQGELEGVSEAAPCDDSSGRRSRVPMVVAAISVTALTLVIIFASHG